jgi:hypothetical protein
MSEELPKSRRCSVCKKEKEPNRHDNYCKDCRQQYNRDYKAGIRKGGKQRNPKYSLYTPEEKQQLFEFQNHRCGICNREFDSLDDMVVDHDHETGETRGLLCSRCNQGLGFFLDDIMFLSAAISYLENIPLELMYLQRPEDTA